MKYIKRVLMVIVIIIIVIGAYFTFQGYQMYEKAIKEKPVSQMVAEIKANSDYLALDQLPDMYKNAVIAVEDRRFYEHGGIDLYAIGRAISNDIMTMSFVEGGSTITQQLAKNMYLTQEKKIERKIAEVFLAFDIEKECSKDEILELYVNSIYFGDGYYCIKDASFGYFDKLPIDMNDYESTMLAGIPNAPSVYSLSESATLASQRQTQVLNRMVKCKYLTQVEADNIKALGSVEQIDNID